MKPISYITKAIIRKYSQALTFTDKEAAGQLIHIMQEYIGGDMTIEEAEIIAVNMCDHLDAKEQTFFIAGFQEAIKYLNHNQPLDLNRPLDKWKEKEKMKRLQRDSVLVSLIETLREKGSWCGETHVQKVSYFLQELLHVPLGFNFILYKHSPYSFDLSDALAQMEADFIIKPIPQNPYAPTITLEPTGELFKKRFPKTIAKHRSKVEFVGEKLASKNVAQLERVATAMYVTLEENSASDQSDRAARIHELKPHVSVEQAMEAVKEFDQIQSDAQDLQN